jgi:hypothetical protein
MFKPGDIIYWGEECFEVLESQPNNGKVKQGKNIIKNFYWEYQGYPSRLATNEEKKQWGYLLSSQNQ